MGDAVHQWTAPLHDALLVHPQAADAYLIVSSAVIDVVGVWLLLSALFGPTIRPFLGLLMLFAALRQLCQALCALPAPAGNDLARDRRTDPAGDVRRRE